MTEIPTQTRPTFAAPGPAVATRPQPPADMIPATDSDLFPSAVQCTAPAEGAPATLNPSTESDLSDAECTASAVTFRERLAAGVMARLADYWVPPSLWTGRWPALKEISDYAHKGGWTTPGGTFRVLGIGWNWAVALPVATVCRYLSWFTDRPGRFLLITGLLYLLSQTTPVQFVLGLF